MREWYARWAGARKCATCHNSYCYFPVTIMTNSIYTHALPWPKRFKSDTPSSENNGSSWVKLFGRITPASIKHCTSSSASSEVLAFLYASTKRREHLMFGSSISLSSKESVSPENVIKIKTHLLFQISFPWETVTEIICSWKPSWYCNCH